MAIRHLISRHIAKSRVAVVGAVLVLAAGTAAVGAQSSWFRAGDAGVRDAERTAGAFPVGAASTHSGLTLKVIAVISDGTQTALSVEVRGKPELGDTLFDMERPTLVSARGDLLFATSASGEKGGGRTWVIVFPPLPDIEEGFTLKVGGVELIEWSDYQAFGRAGSSSAPASHRVDGPWHVAVPKGAASALGGVTQHVQLEAQLPKGAMVVQEVVNAPTGVVVRGVFVGLSRDEVEGVLLTEAKLHGLSTDAQFISGRSGFGDDSAQFEFRFSHLTGSAMLSVGVEVREGAPQSVRTLDGASPTFALSLP